MNKITIIFSLAILIFSQFQCSETKAFSYVGAAFNDKEKQKVYNEKEKEFEKITNIIAKKPDEAIEKIITLYKDNEEFLRKKFYFLREAFYHDNSNPRSLFYWEQDKYPINYNIAFKLYSKAAEMGDILSKNRLAYMYDKGLGTTIDKKKSFELALESAKNDINTSKFLVAHKYEIGDGISMDYIKAYAWYYMASNVYYPIDSPKYSPSEEMENLEKVMTPSQVKKAQELAKEYRKKYYEPRYE